MEVPLKPEKASGDVISDGENGRISTEMPETSGLKTSEKKVRFSEELLEMAHESLDSVTAETTAGSQVHDGSDEKQTAQHQNISDCLAEDKEMEDETLMGTEMKEEEKKKVINEEFREASCLSISSGQGDVCISDEEVKTPPVELNKTCCGMMTFRESNNLFIEVKLSFRLLRNAHVVIVFT